MPRVLKLSPAMDLRHPLCSRAEIVIDADGLILKHRRPELVGTEAWSALAAEAVAPGEGWTKPFSHPGFLSALLERKTGYLYLYVGPLTLALAPLHPFRSYYLWEPNWREAAA